MTEDEALRVVGHLLEHHPTTEAYARDVRGATVLTTTPDACCWCLTGALKLVAWRFGLSAWPLSVRAAQVLIEDEDPEDVCSFLAARWDESRAWRESAIAKLKRAGLCCPIPRGGDA